MIPKETKIAKQKLEFDLIQSCRDRGIDPVAEFWKTLALVDDPAIKAKLLLELFDYIYPKKKAVEHTISLDTTAQALSHDEVRAILLSDPFTVPRALNEPKP
jgi:hypothetical protein